MRSARRIIPALLLAVFWLPGGALAQTEPGAVLAPRLPLPSLGDDAAPMAFLQSAAQALAAGRNGEAQEAMERAESRALDRSVRPSQSRVPDPRKLVQQIAAARAALAAGDRGLALQLLQTAMQNPEAATADADPPNADGNQPN